MTVVAHVSDTHVGNEVQDPAARMAAVMDHLLAMSPRPDVLVVTGDVADHGLAQEYAVARAWLDRWPSDEHSSRIVFITRRVPQRWVAALLDAIGEEVAGVDQ